MKSREQALLLYRKAADDMALLVEVITSAQVSDEIFGFHCQQAAEKLLKALLSASAVDFPRSHNLRLLMDMLADSGNSLPGDLADLDLLTPYGTLFRYESLSVDAVLDRQRFLKMIRVLYQLVENSLAK